MQPETLSDELLLCVFCMNHQHIAVTFAGIAQRLTGSDSNYSHFNTTRSRVTWQKKVEKAGILGGCCRLKKDEILVRQADLRQKQKCREQGDQRFLEVFLHRSIVRQNVNMMCE